MEPEDGQYSYLAWVDWGSSSAEPDAVIRTWTSPQGYDLEERYITESGWMRSRVREELDRGRRDGRLDPIDKATADQIVERWEQRRAGQA
ncbi:hypothetical protein AB0A63_25780 [Lentzea sp. NPDC042327]|uniref:hypothetical protein n=1 Tax=Lentzea sp. NPDC042327 TaxID=3154801 RepID=UPI00340B83FC